MTENTFSFEQAYVRLEEILEKMNSGKVSLEESLNLFEEGSKLITCCNKKLVEAEQKIEILVKEKNGELALNASGQPITEPYFSTQATLSKSM